MTPNAAPDSDAGQTRSTVGTPEIIPGRPFVFAQASFPAPSLAPAPQRQLNRRNIAPVQARTPSLPEQTKWDKIGVGLSALCTIKCLGIPVLAAVLPIGGVAAYAHNPLVVWAVAGLALPVAATQLIYREIKSGRYLTPIAALASSIALSLGAIGHSISGNDSKSSANIDTSASSTCMCGCSPHKVAATTSGRDSQPSLSGQIQSGAHSNLLLGAFGLGLLHLNRFKRNYASSKSSSGGECGGGESCKCDSAKS